MSLHLYDNSSAETGQNSRMKTSPPPGARIFFAFALSLLTAMTAFAGDTNQPAASPGHFTVKLRYGKEIALTQAAAQMLYSNAVMLVESSSFNSSKSATTPLPWNVSEIAGDYRVAISGPYLLVSFKPPHEFTTPGGLVTVREIVIAMNENFGASNRSELFTIDDEGRVIEHGKYSGQVLLELLKIAKKLANDA
jgi:hypothetical protein